MKRILEIYEVDTEDELDDFTYFNVVNRQPHYTSLFYYGHTYQWRPVVKIWIPFTRGEWQCGASRQGEYHSGENNFEIHKTNLEGGGVKKSVIARLQIECSYVACIENKIKIRWNVKHIEYKTY